MMARVVIRRWSSKI